MQQDKTISCDRTLNRDLEKFTVDGHVPAIQRSTH